MSEPIISLLDAVDLMTTGLLLPGPSKGSQRLHKRRLNRYSDAEYQRIPLTATLQNPPSGYAFTLIPVSLISWETLHYIGFDEAKAAELWDKWSNSPTTGPRRETDPDDTGLQVKFIDFVTSSFDNIVDTSDEDDLLWRARLKICGLDVEMIDSILDPDWSYLRRGESCIFWAKDTVKTRYAGLKEIQRTSREREMRLRRIEDHTSGI